MDRRRRYALPFAAVWLVVLLGPAGDILDRTSGLGSVVGVALLVLFGALYLVVVATSFERRRAWRIQLLVAAMLAVACAVLPFSGQSGLTTFVFVAVALQLVLTWRPAIAATAAVVALLLVIERAAGWTDAWSYAFSVVAAAMAMFGVVRMSERTRAELEAETERASYAVVAERERMASDLHDVLGHSLTVIAVKSELAGRLLDVDPERARAEVADIERLAREALADARATVGNYRDVSLAAELVAARRALDAAGIEPDLPNAVDEVPGRLRQVFGHVVREGVTNVVRHSGAGRCTVRLAPDRVEVLDDGRGAAAAADATASGLEGLRRRAELAGCVLEAGARTGGGYRLAVVVAP
ncbi:MAG TPA: histidine kinase [Candidatus Nanopelagicales bacterium]|nr:histidine kinase [Candidatus Nanopelagicales bacterium]